MIDIASRLLKARLRVILTSPFFGSLLMRLPLVPDASVPTFRTNGRVIQYNPDYAAQLSDPELRGVLVHEVCHCAQGHLWRMGQRDLDTWNRAADYAVNGLLAKYTDEQRQLAETANGRAGFMPPWEVPANFLLDPALSELSTEEIYHRLSKPTPPADGNGAPPPNQGRELAPSGSQNSSAPSPQSPPSNPSRSAPGTSQTTATPEPSSPGELEPPDDDEPGDTPLEAEWQIAVTQAATAAKMAGALPGSLQRLIGELLTPRVPWREVLREFIRQRTRDDYSFTRPNRRYMSQPGPGRGVILPSLHSERMGRLAIGVDTSGSITDRILAEFQAEIQAALDECQPETIEVIYCDAAIRGTQEFTPGDTVRLEAKGGGGTAFAPVFDHLAKSDETPVACIYLTDGYGPMPDHEPDFPVLWASTDRTSFPFGTVVAVK
jgi:predicted metal-dependent peptidase